MQLLVSQMLDNISHCECWGTRQNSTAPAGGGSGKMPGHSARSLQYMAECCKIIIIADNN
eukprot:2900264-Amphidinium_carterae.1